MNRKTWGWVQVFISLVIFYMVFYVQMVKVSHELNRLFIEGHYVVKWLIGDSIATAVGIVLMVMGMRNLR